MEGLEKNPLDDIHNSRSVELVVKNGRACTPQELERREPQSLPAPPG